MQARADVAMSQRRAGAAMRRGAVKMRCSPGPESVVSVRERRARPGVRHDTGASAGGKQLKATTTLM
jgi:hypothetical protein